MVFNKLPNCTKWYLINYPNCIKRQFPNTHSCRIAVNYKPKIKTEYRKRERESVSQLYPFENFQ